MFGRATEGYVRLSGALIRKSAVALILLAGCGVAGYFISGKLPTSFVPDEDQGYLYLNIQLPNAASLQRTEEVTAKVEDILAKTPGVKYTTSVLGFSLLSFVRTSYNAFIFVTMKDWDDRKTRAEQFQAIKAHLNRELSKLPEGVAFSFSPPAIPGVGTSGGFTFVLEDRAGKDVQFLSDNLDKFMAAARKRPEIGGLTTTFLPSVPQQFVEVDRDKVIKQGVPINDVYRTIQAFMGGLFVNYFNRFGRQWQVYVEAERRIPHEIRERRPVLRAQRGRRNGAAVRADQIRIAAPAPNSPCATTNIARRNSTARRARLQLRPGDEGAGRSFRPNHAARDGLRLHGHVVPGKEGAGRRVLVGDLRILAAVRVPDSRRAL